MSYPVQEEGWKEYFRDFEKEALLIINSAASLPRYWLLYIYGHNAANIILFDAQNEASWTALSWTPIGYCVTMMY